MKKINKKYSIIGGIVVVVVIILILVSRSGAQTFESATVGIADVIQDIDVTGKIAPEQKAELAFEKTGIVTAVSVKVGDKVIKGKVLGSLDTREARAAYQSAQANVLSEQAKLEESLKGTRKEELAITTQSYANSAKTFSNTIRDTFSQVDSAIRSNVDIFFDNTDGYYPRLNVRLTSNDHERELENIRASIISVVTRWNKEGATLGNSIDVSATLAKQAVSDSKNLVDTLLNYLKDITDEERTAILDAQQEINSINDNLISAQTNYENSKGEYILKKSGNTSETIRSQQAKVEQAIAQAMSDEAVLQKMTITAPFDGVVTLVEPTVGETMSANEVAFTVMTAEQYKIEVFVPESNISKVNLGNMAKVTLDAYGKEVVFDANVSLIDPAETIVEGIPTYKVTLSIVADPRIRSGMTADINIITSEKKGILSIPTRSIIEKDGQVFVRKVDGDTYTEVPVAIGLKGSNGNTELVSGLNVGDIVVTKIK